HLGASILEHEHVRDLRPRAELLAAFRPQVDDLADAFGPERPEGRVVLGRVEDDLAAPVRHRRPAVREPADVVRVWRLEPARAERATRRRQVRPVLARADDVGRRAGVDVDAEVRAPVDAGRWGGLHATSRRCGVAPPRRSRRWRGAITIRSMCSARIVRASLERPSSVTSTWTSSRRAVLLRPRTPHLVWSATTTTRAADSSSA